MWNSIIFTSSHGGGDVKNKENVRATLVWVAFFYGRRFTVVEKIFKVMSESEENLTAEAIAKALLTQITLNPSEPDAKFVVMEMTGKNNCCNRKKMST